MNFNNRISAPALLAAASLAFSPAAWSLGLGQATVESFLNQPLKARIDLISQPSDDLTSITARMASADDYALIGVNVEGIPVPVRFTVEDIDGDAYLSATSNLPISDPVLRLIVEVNWSSGRMLREYTLFLDPPSVPEAAPAPRIEQRANVKTTPAAKPPREVSTAEAPAAATEPERSARSTVAAGSEYGPVRSGETLWSIASNWSRGTDLSINQVMIAIQRENPEAFLNDNINLLKRGAILRMPQAAQVEGVSAAAANREVALQEEAFSEGKSTRSVISPATPLLAEDSADVNAGASEGTAPAEPTPAPTVADTGADEMAADGEAASRESEPTATAAEPGADQDLLELIPPSEDSDPDVGSGFEELDEDSDSGLDAVALRENLARTEEELINQQQQNTYLEERIRELEAQLESNKEAPVDDAELTAMQDRLQEQRQAAAEPASRDVPWYNRLTFWVIGLLVIVVAFVGWLFSRRSQSEIAAEESLRSIQDEAEDVLRVLSDDAQAESEPEPEPEPEPEAEVETDAGADQTEPRPQTGHDEAELLDEESSDPEIQLDLARAYISMGDKEAARVILEEVISNGNEEQQEDARKMLEVLSS